MPLSTDVNLPRSHAAVFPDRCVRCDRNTHGNKMRVRTHSIAWLTSLLMIFGKPFTVHIPVCKTCASRIRNRELLSFLSCITVAGFTMFFVWPQVTDFVPETIRKWVAVGLILITLLPILLFSIFNPPAFDITAYPDSVDYEFRCANYAKSFAELNDDAEWVKME